MQPRKIATSTLSVVRAAHRSHVFRRGMGKFLRNPEKCTSTGSNAIKDLIYGWGNESWSASDEFLAGCIQHALSTRGPILECGSGLSTILIGAIAKMRGITHWALEHSPDWATKAQRHLRAYEIDSVKLCVRPLLDYGQYSWYDPPLKSMPRSFALVICDGPPGHAEGGRRGFASIMGTRLRTGSVILLDDAIRAEERKIAREWKSKLGTSFELHGRTRPYIKMTVLGKRCRPYKTARYGDAPSVVH